ncbi:MAG: RusA family crossover junction endodeoxyribonuclease [Prochlorothrix sp.]|nr:RusA family crossover junction endodeoxyribonuclease [Prochlorothrix sp.]
MSVVFEILIPRRPLSQQANRSNLRKWKDYIYGRARAVWRDTPLKMDGLQFTLVYFCGDSPADIDNIIKPIQDALKGVVYADDAQITDADSHRRSLAATLNMTNLPKLVIQGFLSGEECVYVRVSPAPELNLCLLVSP